MVGRTMQSKIEAVEMYPVERCLVFGREGNQTEDFQATVFYTTPQTLASRQVWIPDVV